MRNELVPTPGRPACAPRRPTSARRSPPGLAFRAIGYRGIPLPGVPFDERSGTIPNDGGRILDPATGIPLRGEYVVGWIKRGPSGVIGTNKKDAQETVDAILADLSQHGDGGGRHHARPPTPDAVPRVGGAAARAPARARHLRGWEAIDRHERALGEPAGRPRVKLTRSRSMLRVAADRR